MARGDSLRMGIAFGPRRAGAFLALALLWVVAPPVDAAFEGDATGLIAILRAQAQKYEHGEGAPRDPVQAVELYCEAARLGDAESQFSLGWIYANGRGVPRDDRLASIFFGIAAEQGHEHAQKMVGLVGPAVVDLPDCMRDPAPPPVQEAVAPPVVEEDTFVAVTPEQKRAADIVRRLAPEYRVNPQFALAIIRAESNFDPNARSPKNAQGLMQLIPETAARFNVRKPYDPVQNIRGGLAYLRWLLAYFRGNVSLVAAAYNAGERTVERYRGVPPYAETRAYVERIRRHFRKDLHPYDAKVTAPSPELPRMYLVRGRQ